MSADHKRPILTESSVKTASIRFVSSKSSWLLPFSYYKNQFNQSVQTAYRLNWWRNLKTALRSLSKMNWGKTKRLKNKRNDFLAFCPEFPKPF
jgi:hypothetical protein